MDPPIPYGPLPNVYVFPEIMPVAILDSNVIIEGVSYHDLDQAHGDERKFQFRKKRMRDTFILFEHLHRNRFATFGMRDEPILKLLELVPAEQATALTEYIKTAIDFLVEDIFRGSNFGCFDDDIPEPRANAADAFLVDAAKHYGVPIITNEGVSHDGTRNLEKEIPKRAGKLGVQVVTPGEFWAGKIDVELPRFNGQRVRYAA